MRCYICDRVLSEPRFNRDYIQWEPCEPCLEVIRDTVSAFHDRPAAAEDELPEEKQLELKYFGPLGDIF